MVTSSHMLSQKLQDIFIEIAMSSQKMASKYVDKSDLTGRFNYVSIFAKTEEEYKLFTDEISANGDLFDQQLSGNYIKLYQPLKTPIGEIDICRIRVPDKNHLERGYLDFEVTNYQGFKKKYLQKQYFSLLGLPQVEMVELLVPEFDVRAYFPDSL